MKIYKIIIISFLLTGCFNHLNAQLKSFNEDPGEAGIIYDDIINFMNAFNMLETSQDTVDILQEHYIDKGTPGLKIFIEKYGLTATELAKAIGKNPEDYNALENKLSWLRSQEDSIRLYFKKLKRFINDAVFPPTYYLVGSWKGIGSGSAEGQLITVEKKAADIVDSGLKTLIIHELIHLNQANAIGSLDKYLAIYKDEKSLLAITIREGTAEFFADLVTGRYTQNKARSFVLKNERDLWERFRIDMMGAETKDWMWKKPENPEQPSNVGYVLGALIVEYYYKRSSDVDRATQEILSVTDYEDFLSKSQYSNKFK